MAFLDFIRNRTGQQPVAEEQQPKTAKQMYTDEVAQDTAPERPAEEIPESPDKGAGGEVEERIDKATQYLKQRPGGRTAARAEEGNNSEAGQERSPALEPGRSHRQTRLLRISHGHGRSRVIGRFRGNRGSTRGRGSTR
jgi:hypothetical protein